MKSIPRLPLQMLLGIFLITTGVFPSFAKTIKSSAMCGAVVNQDGNPVRFLTVKITGPEYFYRGTDQDGVFAVQTLPNGKYKLQLGENLPKSAITIDLKQEDFIENTLPSSCPLRVLVSSDGRSIQGIEENPVHVEWPSESKFIRIPQKQRLAGSFKDQTGAVITGIPIELWQADRIKYSSQTDRSGKYDLGEVEPGQYRLVVRVKSWFYPVDAACNESICVIGTELRARPGRVIE